MEKLRAFVDGFWKGFQFPGSLLGLALSDRYNVEYVSSPANCDVSIESYFKRKKPWPIRHLSPSPHDILERRGVKRIFFSGEPRKIPVGIYHGIISHEPWLGDRSFRLPLWVLSCRLFGETSMADDGTCEENGYTADQLMTASPLLTRAGFACAIFGNLEHSRYSAIDKLSKFGQVDLFGKPFGRTVADKIVTMRNYRFNICYENTIIPGYVTEKSLHAKMAGCIPLWWGDPSYRLDFDEDSLINVYEYGSDFERIFDEVDFERIANTPLITKSIPDYRTDLSNFYEFIINGTRKRFGEIV